MISQALTENLLRIATYQASDSMIVHLILASGSNAGVTAPIQRGYYLIGRHHECQIRPKTRSVSRRHGLLHHDESALRLIDLGSTSGTKINDEKIAPKRWYRLDDGDVLRFGKTVFRVSLQQTLAVESNGNTPSEPTSKDLTTVNFSPTPEANASASIVQGEAWQEFDIASFLLTADEVAREERYDSIRKAAAARQEELQEDSNSFEDTPTVSNDVTLAGPKSKAMTDQRPRDVTGVIGTRASVAADKATAAAARGRSLTRAAAQRGDVAGHPRRRFLDSLSFTSLIDAENLKVCLAVLVTLGILGYAGYSGCLVVQGPPVEFVDGID